MDWWRFGRGWTDEELQERLAALAERGLNFDPAPERMTPERGWVSDEVVRRLGTEAAGPPERDGLFERARERLVRYEMSDPNIVEAHYDPDAPLVGRDMLLEFKTLGFRFLNGVRVGAVRDEADGGCTTFGFRYETLEGHVEQGYEWFLVEKEHETGDVRFRVQECWRTSEAAPWWMRLGFQVMGGYYRRQWFREAPGRLRAPTDAAEQPSARSPGPAAHAGRKR